MSLPASASDRTADAAAINAVADPANADLHLADAGTPPGCDPRYDSFIDHIVLDKRAGADLVSFAEMRYAAGETHHSDHCPVAVTLAR